MPKEHLHITLIQSDIVWEDKAANLEHYEKIIASIEGPKNVVVLPEMFSTGFSMNPEKLAEPMSGQTVTWMINMAVEHRCILTGSLIIKVETEEGTAYYNRLIWVQPNGTIGYYDKKHLFGYAGEDKHYNAGDTRLIAQVNGWKINLMICYDLRFPVWARNKEGEYDVLIYVANWPEQRSLAWKTLLQARAIENMSYVVGVNRIGQDPKGNNYSGDSSVFSPLGEQLFQHSHTAICSTITLDKIALENTRKALPFLNDADKFILL